MACTSLPPNAAIRLRRTLATRFADATDDRPLIENVVELCVPWLLEDNDKLWLDRAKRLRIGAEASAAIKRLARSLALMVGDADHGHQAAKAARKALRAARTRRVDMDGLLDLATGYRLLRTAHRREKGSTRPYARAETMYLADGTMVATRITSDRALADLGQQAGNCLGEPTYRKRYASRLRSRKSAFWRIDAPNLPDKPIWVIETSLQTGDLLELQHTNRNQMLKDRDGLLEFLAAHAEVDRSWQSTLAEWSLSPELIAAAKTTAVERLHAEFAGETWRFEVATPGMLVAFPEDGPSWIQAWRVVAWMLHGPMTAAPETLAIQWPLIVDPELGEWADDGCLSTGAYPPPAGPRTMLDLAIRSELRHACRANLALHRACLSAFSMEDTLFLEDWFGMLSPARNTARRG